MESDRHTQDAKERARGQAQRQSQQQLQEAEGQLAHPDPAVRLEAVMALPGLPRAAAVRGLAQALQDPDERVCAEARRALRRVSTPVVKGVVDALTSVEEELGDGEISGGLPVRSPRLAAAIAHAIRESIARTGRTFSDSTQLIREDRDR
jgi:HEAT repeat protein